MSEALLKPSHHKEKRYVVQLSRPPTDDDIDALRSGVVIASANPRGRHTSVHIGPTAACSVRRIDPKAPQVLEFVLNEGRHRQIRKMCKTRGLNVG